MLADCPPEMRAALDVARAGRPGHPPEHPAGGHVWFTTNREGVPCCAMCGTRDHRRLCADHCHVTGLYRGHLCVGCNLAEGRNSGPHWYWWRRHAPRLAARTLDDDYLERSPHLTDDEVMSLPMDDLLHLAKERALATTDPALDQWLASFADDVERIRDERAAKAGAA